MVKRVLALILFFSTFLFASSTEETKRRIEQVLNSLPSTTTAGIMVYNPLTQDTIFKLNHLIPMIPASNTKLFTSAAALALMGGDYYLSTKLFTDDNNLRDGEINGNLYLKGYGNPLFSDHDLNAMAVELRNLGIRRVTGSIVGDDTYFDNIYRRDDWIKDEVANVKLPPVSAIVVDRNRTTVKRKRGKRTVTVTENISNPPLSAAVKLRQKLINQGIEVNSSAVQGETPSPVYLITEKKILLREVLDLINKNSDNFLSEVVFKAIGAFASGEQGNSFYSTQAILSFLDDNGIYSKGTSLVDGSGISRFNKATPAAIVGLLEKMYFDLKSYDDYFSSFSVAGVDGTLRRRMAGSNAENNFHGKTGTLNGVSSLSGYVTTESGDDLIICILFEFSRGGHDLHRSAQDRIIRAVSETFLE
jgi:serine-type D-Ala-D-Ala carboxypeptidase/endopeptidase (penicillin-binding protein 4)